MAAGRRQGAASVRPPAAYTRQGAPGRAAKLRAAAQADNFDLEVRGGPAAAGARERQPTP
jgi:hypothetical protein